MVASAALLFIEARRQRLQSAHTTGRRGTPVGAYVWARRHDENSSTRSVLAGAVVLLAFPRDGNSGGLEKHVTGAVDYSAG